MIEYGGYIQLDDFHGKEYYTNAISLNSGRSCLGYLIEAKKIKKIYLPYFLCSTVKEVCEKYKVEYEFYHIFDDFKPDFKKNIEENAYLYLVNYYGQLTNNDILEFKEKYNNIIIDNAQSFFLKPEKGIDTIYICRKFFGVADGAYLFTDTYTEKEYAIDTCYDRMLFLLGRYEVNASEFYQDYVSNNEYFREKPIMYTSKLSRNILRAIDYEYVKKIRTDNFIFLKDRFKNINELQVSNVEGAFAYPLLLKNGCEIRKKLIEEKIYIPILWPDVFECCEESDLEFKLAKNILPLPVDQRYGIDDMKIIVEKIMELTHT